MKREDFEKGDFEKELEVLSSRSPLRPIGENETLLCEAWYDAGRMREYDKAAGEVAKLVEAIKTMKQLIYLVHPTVSDLEMNDVTARQIAVMEKLFPTETPTPKA